MVNIHNHTAKLIVISGPSGCGKTTIAREILKRHPKIIFSVSATTRPKRTSEINGKDYYFLTREEFEKKIQNGELAEWEEIYGNYYGSLKSEVDRALRSRKSILFDIDVQGALSIREAYPKKTLLIFINPPSKGTLTERLMKRNTETNESLKKRLERVPMEMEKAPQFDFHIVNDDLKEAVMKVEASIGQALNAPG